MDGLIDCGNICEGLVGEVMDLKIAQANSISLSSGPYFGSDPTVSQCARAARAASEPFGVDQTIVLDQHDRLGLSPAASGTFFARPWTVANG
jgi:hypothetical protein